MKKIIKISVILSILLLSVLLLASCGKPNAYDTVQDKGYTVSVRFDVGEGLMGSENYLKLIDVFNVSKEKDTDGDQLVEISLLEPTDEKRGDHKISSISYPGYYFAGWYINPQKRTNESGQYLDEYGNVCAEEDAAFIYEKKWDFSKDVLEVDPNKTYSSNEPVLTLYAAWIPKTNFNICTMVNGEKEVLETISADSIELPQRNMATGLVQYKDFPTIEGKTFNYVYTIDENGKKERITDSILTGNIDYEHGILISNECDIYTEWLDGHWYFIYLASTLNSTVGKDPETGEINKTHDSNNYIICKDINLNGESPFKNITFSGKIQSEDGQCFSLNNIKTNVSPTLDGNSVVCGGVFKKIDSTAEIKNINFENVQLTVGQTPLNTPVTVGLLAGEASDLALIENISFTGENLISLNSMSISSIVNPRDRKVGLLFGIGNNRDIDMLSINCQFTDASTSKLEIEIDHDSGTVYFNNKRQ